MKLAGLDQRVGASVVTGGMKQLMKQDRSGFRWPITLSSIEKSIREKHVQGLRQISLVSSGGRCDGLHFPGTRERNPFVGLLMTYRSNAFGQHGHVVGDQSRSPTFRQAEPFTKPFVQVFF